MSFVSAMISLASIILFSLLHNSDASCFGRDAHFKKSDVSRIFYNEIFLKKIYLQQPIVSQPSRTDPTKVLVTWDKIRYQATQLLSGSNKQCWCAECVDEYNVYVWQENKDVKSANKTVVKNKVGKNVATSAEVIIEPCLNYKYVN